jgi:6,7-dimethyl-8-ribityllumazine synthase
MLRSNTPSKTKAGKAAFAIVASEYNSEYVDAMVEAAKAELKRSQAKQIQVFRVPGAFEIPVIVARLARNLQHAPVAPKSKQGGTRHTPYAAIICLGVILRGETIHAAHIGEAVSRALMEIQVRYEVPIIHEVLLLENEQQARVRCLGKKHNRGAEAAQTALKMANLMSRI